MRKLFILNDKPDCSDMSLNGYCGIAYSAHKESKIKYKPQP
ncbi:hypothetical protein BC670_1463 [Flavobacterium branchiophilum]|uniref:Uncharacterized protein n=1 Tax=Flavobacterium branchiophilum TaxID=55197 RepID=A0A543G3A6_9FLAO|nr:hypothetical protein BC670_1463 [Flavobacterium branchiophilum]